MPSDSRCTFWRGYTGSFRFCAGSTRLWYTSTMSTAEPVKYDRTIWVGNHEEFRFRFWDGVGTSTTQYPLTGIRVNLTVFNGDTELVTKSTEDGSVTIANTNEMSTILTPEDTRTIAAEEYDSGVKPRYEVELWNGTVEKTWIYGNLRLRGGANLDE